eukprot:631756_1
MASALFVSLGLLIITTSSVDYYGYDGYDDADSWLQLYDYFDDFDEFWQSDDLWDSTVSLVAADLSKYEMKCNSDIDLCVCQDQNTLKMHECRETAKHSGYAAQDMNYDNNYEYIRYNDEEDAFADDDYEQDFLQRSDDDFSNAMAGDYSELEYADDLIEDYLDNDDEYNDYDDFDENGDEYGDEYNDYHDNDDELNDDEYGDDFDAAFLDDDAYMDESDFNEDMDYEQDEEEYDALSRKNQAMGWIDDENSNET